MENYYRIVKRESEELKNILIEYKELSIKVGENVDEIERLQAETNEFLQQGEVLKQKMTEIVDTFEIEMNDFEVVSDVNLVSENSNEVDVKVMDNKIRWEEAYLKKVNEKTQPEVAEQKEE